MPRRKPKPPTTKSRNTKVSELPPKARAELVGIHQYNLEVVGDDAKRALRIARKVTKGIEKAADICRISPPVCVGNMGLPRAQMPQIQGDANVVELEYSDDPGDKAKAKAILQAGGDKNDPRTVLQQFLSKLETQGIKTRRNRVPVGNLKATQREIQAAKVYGMAHGHLKGMFPTIDKQVIVSNDGHILDGHHRWAALLTIDPARYMSVLEVDLPMKQLLHEAAAMPGVYRADFAGRPLGAAAQRSYKAKHKSRLGRKSRRKSTTPSRAKQRQALENYINGG